MDRRKGHRAPLIDRIRDGPPSIFLGRTGVKAYLPIVVFALLLYPQISSAWSKPTTRDIARLASAAESGDAKAQAELGDAYHFGFSVKIDDKKAVELWKKSAEQNYAHAEFRLGEIYGDDSSGDGTGVIPPDGAEAMKWFERARGHGDPRAKCAIGQVYELALNGVSQDHDKAIKLFTECLPPVRTLALNGDTDAELILALLYDMGWGLPEDKTEAFKWRLSSAEEGFPGGEAYVALCYYAGVGVQKNIRESVKWMSIAADQGVSLAQLWLGSFYAKGEGLPKDNVKAYMWLDLALIQGERKAGNALVEVSKSLTPDQLAEATKLAAAWQAQHLASQ
jgi:TPR repeat protein